MSAASVAQDSNTSPSQPKVLQQYGSMRNVLSGDFTKSLIKDDDNSVKEL